MRAAVLVFSIACSSHVDLPSPTADPLPRKCNASFAWGDTTFAAASATAYLPPENPTALAVRFSTTSDACGERNAAIAGDFIDVVIDGAVLCVDRCMIAPRGQVYDRTQVHVVVTHGTTQTSLDSAVNYAIVSADLSVDRGAAYFAGTANIDLGFALPSGAPVISRVVSPICRANNNCSSP